MTGYPEQVQRLHDALQSLAGVSEVELGIRNLEGLRERDFSLPGEFGDLPHLALRRTNGGRKDELLVTAEIRFTQDFQGWVALEFLAWWVRDLSRGGVLVQMRPLALPPKAYGTQLGRTLKFVIEFFFVNPGEDNDPVLEELANRADSLERSLRWYADALDRPTVADPQDLEALRRCAENEDASAQLRLAHCYADGEGVKRNRAQAFRWYERAAGHNHPEALTYLGRCYAKGEGVAADPARAVRYYRQAAEADFPLAMGFLGGCYEEGTGVRKDEAEAVKWYRRGAENGDVGCMAQLGECYEYGRGVRKNLRKALEYYQQALDQGFDAVQPAVERVEAALQ